MITLQARTEAERIYEWRVRQFCNMGCSRETALKAAYDKNVDLHEVEKLIRAGCKNADLAVRIVS